MQDTRKNLLHSIGWIKATHRLVRCQLVRTEPESRVSDEARSFSRRFHRRLGRDLRGASRFGRQLGICDHLLVSLLGKCLIFSELWRIHEDMISRRGDIRSGTQASCSQERSCCLLRRVAIWFHGDKKKPKKKKSKIVCENGLGKWGEMRNRSERASETSDLLRFEGKRQKRIGVPNHHCVTSPPMHCFLDNGGKRKSGFRRNSVARLVSEPAFPVPGTFSYLTYPFWWKLRS